MAQPSPSPSISIARTALGTSLRPPISSQHPMSSSNYSSTDSDVLSVLGNCSIANDISDSCERLGSMTNVLLQRFDSVASLLHTADITKPPNERNWSLWTAQRLVCCPLSIFRHFGIYSPELRTSNPSSSGSAQMLK